MSHKSSSPLTAISFLSDGQQVALGSMTGEIFIHDLRRLSSPIFTIEASKAPIYSLAMQPSIKPSRRTLTNISPETKAMAMQDPTTDIPQHKIRTVELSSPINKDSTSMGKTFERNLSSTCSKPYSHIDERELLSPINKENRNSFSNTPPAVSLFSDSFLSPVKDNSLPEIDVYFNKNSRLLNNLCQQSNMKESLENMDATSSEIASKDRNTSEGCVKTTTILAQKNHQASLLLTSESSINNITRLSPLCLSKNFEIVSRNQLSSPINKECTSTGKTFDQNISSTCSKPYSHIEERELLSPINKENRNLGSDDSPAVSTFSDTFLSPVRNNNLPENDVYCNKNFELLNNLSQQSNTEEPLENLNVSTLSDIRKDRNTSGGIIQNSLSFPQNIEVESSNQFNTIVKEICLNKEGNTGVASPSSENMHAPEAIGSVNIDLIRNCISDELRNMQFNINERFVNMHWNMIKYHLQLKKEIMNSIAEHSLNEEVLLENQRLREKLKRFESNF